MNIIANGTATETGRGRLTAPIADLSANVHEADKSAMGAVNRPLPEVTARKGANSNA
ncbi:MAG TPA: hypothetical protein VKU38_07985 [Ktedonobacteraceae bacterium]|nr:hypothetical protein [Ktedonobacteraceae bacterium]